MSAIQWLHKFLEGRDCLDFKPDGRPLYAYKCNTEEFLELKNLLQNAERRGVGGGENFTFSLSTNHLFALYCSEWWRRHYTGGPWAWAPIVDSLGWEHGAWNIYTKFVVKGLKYWKRDLIRTNTGRQFLLSVASEGGIPINVLEREGASFTNYLKALIREYGHYVQSGLTSERIAKDNLFRLPASWRQDQIANLAGKIIEQLWVLKSEIGETTEPVKTLNEKHPGWDKELPLELESQQSETLINSLLNTARAVASGSSQILRVERSLEDDLGEWKLTAKLLLPKEIHAHQVTSMGAVSSINEIPERAEIYRVIQNQRVLIARLTGEGDTRFVRPVPGATRSFDENADAEIGVVLVARGQDLTSLPVAGADALDHELPWCFVANDEEQRQFRWVAQGGCQRREPDVYVLSSQKPTQLSDHDDTDVTEISNDLLSRSFWRIQNPAEIYSAENDESYRVEPGLENIAARDYRLIGYRQYFPQTRFTLFQSVPNIQLVNEDSTITVPNQEIFWRPMGARQWQQYDKQLMIGDIEIRHRRNDVVLASWRLSILSSILNINVVPVSRLIGKITFNDKAIKAVHINSSENLEVFAEKSDGGWDVELKRTSTGVGDISGRLEWENGCNLKLSFPFPAKGAAFVDENGKDLASSSVLTLSRLYGFRAQAVSPGVSKKYQLSGSLLFGGDYEYLPSIEYHKFNYSLISDRYGIGLLPLQQIKEEIKHLFAVSTGVDDRVILQISELGQMEASASVLVEQYEGMLLHNSASDLIYLDKNNSVGDDYDNSILSLVSVNDLNEDSINLDWNEMSNGWTLSDRGSDLIDHTHTYFASIEGERAHKIRPCIIPADSVAEELDEPADLATALSFPDAESRRSAIGQFLSKIALEGSEKQWIELASFVNRLSGVHPDGLDLVEGLLKCPTVMSSLWFRSVTDKSLQNYLQKICDSSPFAWWMISLDQWVESLDTWLNGFVRQIQNEAVENMLIEECVKSLDQLCSDNEEVNAIVDVIKVQLAVPLDGQSAIGDARDRPTDLAWKQLDMLCRAIYVPSIPDWWPQIQPVFNLKSSLPESIREFIHWPIEDMKYQKAVIQAPAIAAGALHSRIEFDENVRIALLAARNFHPSAFATIFRATQSILWVSKEEI
ncbi:MAG: hypothetical protein GY814_01590 [Gammaproteobacteria bacterium]|nr:hypothetical protein [Gammaproteobacteria bacterium]